MTAFQSLPAIPHLEPIFAAIAAANPHDGQARADSIDPVARWHSSPPQDQEKPLSSSSACWPASR